MRLLEEWAAEYDREAGYSPVDLERYYAEAYGSDDEPVDG